MAEIETDVLIIGTGPAGSSMAALLASYGIENMIVNRYRWLANTPRAHITNQRAMEVLRDLGKAVDILLCVPREQAVLKSNGSINVCGKSFIKQGEESWCSALDSGCLPQLFIRPISSPARLSQKTFSPIRSCSVACI